MASEEYKLASDMSSCTLQDDVVHPIQEVQTCGAMWERNLTSLMVCINVQNPMM